MQKKKTCRNQMSERTRPELMECCGQWVAEGQIAYGEGVGDGFRGGSIPVERERSQCKLIKAGGELQAS